MKATIKVNVSKLPKVGEPTKHVVDHASGVLIQKEENYTSDGDSNVDIVPEEER